MVYGGTPTKTRFKDVVIERKNRLDYVHQEFLLLAYSGGPAWLDTLRQFAPRVERLFTHRLEGDMDFRNRLKRASYRNYCRPVCRIVSTHVWGDSGVSRTPSEDGSASKWFEERKKRANLSRITLDRFWRNSCEKAVAFGCVGVESMAPVKPEGATRSDESRYWPMYSTVSPLEVIAYDYDPDTGELNWILLEEQWSEYASATTVMQKVYRYRYFSKEVYGEEVITVDKNGEHLTKSYSPVKNPVGVVPITFISPYAENTIFGQALLSDLAPINRTIFNLDSLHDDILYQQTFGQLVVQGNNFPIQATGTSRAFTYPENSTHPPQFISPTGQNAKLLEDRATILRLEMYRQALLGPSGGAVNLQYATASGREHDFDDTSQMLRDYAEMMSKAEEDSAVIMGMMLGIEGNEPAYRAAYPSDFQIRSLTGQLENAMQLKAIGSGPALLTRTLWDVIDKLFGNMPDKEKEALKKAVEAEISESHELMLEGMRSKEPFGTAADSGGEGAPDKGGDNRK